MNHYDHLLSPVAVFGRDLTIVYFNASFATFLQLPPRKLRGKSIVEVLGGDFGLGDLVEQCFGSGEPVVTGEVKINGGAEAKEVVVKLFPVNTGGDAPALGLTLQDFSIERVLHEKHRIQLDELKAKNEEIKQYSHGLERLVDARTQELRLERDETISILRSLTQGLIVVEPDLRLGAKASQCAPAMLGRDQLQGAPVLDVLFPHAEAEQSRDDRKNLERLLTSAFCLFIPDQFEDLVRFAPQRIRFPDPLQKGAWKIYALNFSSVVENDAIVKVLVALRDDTELEELRQHGVTMHRKIVEALELAGNGRGNPAFERFSREMGKLAREIKGGVESLSPSESAAVFRTLHTIKGGTRTFALNYLQHFAHEAENFVDAIRSGKELSPVNREQLKDDIAWLERGLLALERLVIGAEGDRRGHDDLARAWRASVDVIKTGFAQLAEDLGKRARLSFSSSQPLGEEERVFLEQCLVHLLRNALDHGIESPESRIAIDKHPEAAVSVRVTDDEDMVTVLVEDDGCGIDRQKVKKLAIERGLLRTDGNVLSLDQLLAVLAHPGFSTKGQVTDVSGRGVGLDAVRVALQERGGDLKLLHTGGTGTKFQLSWRKQKRLMQAS